MLASRCWRSRPFSGRTPSASPRAWPRRVALEGEQFDFVLINYDLDDGKGTALVAELTKRPERPRIIAVSAHERGNAELLEAGADAVCAKMDFAEIGAVVARLSGGQA